MLRNWEVTAALASARALVERIDRLTEQEVLYALEVEAGSRRRRVIIDKLIQKAAHFNRANFVQSLQEKYHGTFRKRRTQPR